jgi:hypothetical protein
MASTDYSELQNPDPEYADVQNPQSQYANKNANTPQTKQPTLKSPGPNGEVTIPAVYAWDPPITEQAEVDLFLNPGPAHKWQVTTADFTAITGVTLNPGPGDFIALMGIIAGFQNKSIKRLNFLTHSNKNVIGIAGTAKPDDIYFTTQVSDTDIASYATNGMSFTVGQAAFTLDDVRARFADDAIFVLYGCDTAFDPTTLLTALKNLLQVTVIGFKDKTVFCPPPQTPGSTTFARQGEKMGIMKSGFTCGTDSTTNWRSLITNPNAVKVAK